jgi:hypothetical protein
MCKSRTKAEARGPHLGDAAIKTGVTGQRLRMGYLILPTFTLLFDLVIT